AVVEPQELTRSQQERVGIRFVAVKGNSHPSARRYLIAVRRSLTDLGLVQHVSQLANPGLLMCLLLTGGVVAAVLAEVTFFARGGDLGSHRTPPSPRRSE